MSLYNLDDLAAKGVQCPSCGMTPMGEGCYHICPNSVHYYSPEQERMDEPFYGDDDVRERYMEYCSRHGAYAGDCGGCQDEYYASLDASDIPADVEDFAPQTSQTSEDIPF